MRSSLLRSYVLILLLALAAHAATDEVFKWHPIMPADWKVAPDSTAGGRNAIMLFEKIFVDEDEYMSDDKCYYTIYRRIKVFNNEGRAWGDVTVPLLHFKQKVEMIQGRTVLPEGKEFVLAPTQILEKEIIKAKGLKVKEKSFSLPGMADGCIIEYVIKYRLPQRQSRWLIQKEILLRQGELRWRFARKTGMSSRYESYLSAWLKKNLMPNYIWLPENLRVSVKELPTLKEPEEIVFTVSEVLAFEEEPQGFPDIALKAQLLFYYGGSVNANAYWAELANEMDTAFEPFAQKNKKVTALVADWQALESDEKKIAAAYEWVQQNLKNVAYEDEDEAPGKKFKDNKTADDVLLRGYGSQLDLTLLFRDMLREMNIDAKLAFVVDRDDNIFIQNAKYWQFDRALIAIKHPQIAGKFSFYAPGEPHLPSTQVSWYNEGVSAFLLGLPSQQFAAIPFSPNNTNRTARVFLLHLDEEAKLSGKLADHRLGHAGRELHLLVGQAQAGERELKLVANLKESLPNLTLDSLTVNVGNKTDPSIKLECSVSFPNIEAGPGSRMLLQPFEYLKHDTNPFHAPTRKTSLLFDYSHETIEVMNISLAEAWALEAVPKDTSFSNTVGQCEMRFQSFGTTVSVQRIFRLNRPYWLASDYAAVRKLFQTRQEFNAIALVLRKKEL